MKRIGLAILFVAAASLGVACGEVNQSAKPAPGRSSYDPMARAAGGRQPKGIVETTLAGVNPRDTDYGRVIEGWREEIFEKTKTRKNRAQSTQPFGTHFTAILAPCRIPPTIPLLRRTAMRSCSETRVPFSAAATTRP